VEGNVVTLEDIFLATVAKAPADRAAYLEAACGSDAELRAQVEALPRSHEEAGSLLEQPLFRPGPTVDEPPAAEQPGVSVGPYKLLEQIGEGGMGIVYKAWQAGTKRLVALKMIRSGVEASAEESELFRAEAEAVARFQHPNNRAGVRGQRVARPDVPGAGVRRRRHPGPAPGRPAPAGT
jgi:hypothetical protein